MGIDLTARIRALLLGKPALGNFLWLASDRGIRMVLQMVVGAWSARYLGTDNFGLLNFAMPIIAIFSVICPLGMEGLAVRQIILEPSAAGCWLGTVIGFRAIAATLFAILAAISSVVIRPGDGASLMITIIFAAGMAFQSLESGELYFQARTEMRRLIVPRLSICFLINLVKVGFILSGMSVFWFAFLTAAEQAFSGFVTVYVLRRALGTDHKLRFDFSRGLRLLRECWPLIISALTVIIYMKSAQLVLNSRMSNRQLGIYAAAIRIPESLGFLPAILASSLLPGLLRSYALGSAAYESALLRYIRVNALVAYACCLPISLFAYALIRVLFGSDYHDASPIMMVYIWYLLFAFLGVARAQHLLNLRLTRISLLFSVVGLICNLGLNLWLINLHGALGSAYATVLSQAISAVFVTILLPITRPVGRLQLLAMLTPWRAFSRPKSAA